MNVTILKMGVASGALVLALSACATEDLVVREGHGIVTANAPISVDLASMLVGEFDSENQMNEDISLNVQKEMRHGWINRSFVRVDAPSVGHPVLVGSTAYGGESWYFDKDEFLVWTFSASEDKQSVVMSPQRFSDLERLLPFSRDGKKLSGFTSDDLEPAQSGANCNIVWERSKNGFLGRSQPCYVMSTTKNKMLDWQWEFDLTPDALWISFAGIDEDGRILDGTPPGRPYRLDRLN